MPETNTVSADALLAYTTELVGSYVANNPVPASALPALIASTHAALAGLGQPARDAVERPDAAAIARSIGHDALISFEDGKPYKALRRHLTLRGLTLEQYRRKWGLAVDYPMVAASYSERRSAISKEIGLGQHRRPAEAMPQAAE